MVRGVLMFTALAVLALLSATHTARADDSCRWANDGECDVPQYCDAGTDDTDCEAEANQPAPKPDSCEYANDGECDLPPTCDAGTDTTDCAAESGGPNACRYANDGECDEPNLCQTGTDTADCEAAAALAASGGDDSCRYANDGECDEPNLCQPNTDKTDCAAQAARQVNDPQNSCRYAYDDECDEPNLCDAGTDTADCSAGSGRPDSCRWANDGECDEPGLCNPGTDTTDCSAGGGLGGVLGGLGSLGGLGGALAGPDSCEYANDGECDEPNLCDVGTDTTDCGGIAAPTLGQQSTGDAPRPHGPNHCASARDGTCDEPNRCPPDTDTDDCRVIPVLFDRGTDHTGTPLGWHPLWRGLLAALIAALLFAVGRWIAVRLPSLRAHESPWWRGWQGAHQHSSLAHNLAPTRNSAYDNAIAQRNALAELLADTAQQVNLPLHIETSGRGEWPVTLQAHAQANAPDNPLVALPGRLHMTVEPKDSHVFDCEYKITLQVGHSRRRERHVVELGGAQLRGLVAALSGVPFARALAGVKFRRVRGAWWQIWRRRNRLLGVRRIDWLRGLGLWLAAIASVFALLAWPLALVKPLTWAALLAAAISVALLLAHTIMLRRARPVGWLTAGRPLTQPKRLRHVDAHHAVLNAGASHQRVITDRLVEHLSAAIPNGLQLARRDQRIDAQLDHCHASIELTPAGDDLHAAWSISENSGVWTTRATQGGIERGTGRYVRGVTWDVTTEMPREGDLAATRLNSLIETAVRRAFEQDLPPSSTPGSAAGSMTGPTPQNRWAPPT